MSDNFKKDADVVWPIPGDGKQQEARDAIDNLASNVERWQAGRVSTKLFNERLNEDIAALRDAARQASQLSTQDCSKPYAEIEGEWQPSHASGEPGQDTRYKNLKFLADNLAEQLDEIQEICFDAGIEEGDVKTKVEAVKLLAGREFQRGQQAMAEKAAQACEARVDRDHYRPGNREAEQCAIAIRSLAGAEHPLVGTRKPTATEEAYGLSLEPLAKECLERGAASRRRTNEIEE